MKSHTTVMPQEGIENDQSEVGISCISAFCEKLTLLQKALIVAGFLVTTLVVVLIVVTKGIQVLFSAPLIFKNEGSSLTILRISFSFFVFSVQSLFNLASQLFSTNLKSKTSIIHIALKQGRLNSYKSYNLINRDKWSPFLAPSRF